MYIHMYVHLCTLWCLSVQNLLFVIWLRCNQVYWWCRGEELFWGARQDCGLQCCGGVGPCGFYLLFHLLCLFSPIFTPPHSLDHHLLARLQVLSWAIGQFFGNTALQSWLEKSSNTCLFVLSFIFFLILLLFLVDLCKESKRQQSIQDLLPLMQLAHLYPFWDLYLWVLGSFFSEDVFPGLFRSWSYGEV